MEFEIIEFNKPCTERHTEFVQLFSKADPSLSCSELKGFWASCFKECTETNPWSAAWKISREKCVEFNLYFPRFIDVTVLCINYEFLTADVSIVDHATSEHLQNIPEIIKFVPLLEIYPTKQQDGRDIRCWAQRLDQFRIFYSYLWFPWDDELDCGIITWVSNYLKSRLELFYDISEGYLTETNLKVVTSLIEKGKRIYDKIQTLAQAHEYDIETEESTSDLMKEVQPLWNELELTKDRLQRWLNLKTRKSLNIRQNAPSSSNCYVVLPKLFTLGDLSDYVHRAAQECRSNSFFREAVSSLKNLLSSCTAGDHIFICSGKHIVNNERIDFNLHLRGFNGCTKPIISENASNWYFFKTMADNIFFEKIVIALKTCGVAIFVKEGLLEMEDVILKNENERTSSAIVIGKNATLLANRCEFTGFGTTIICLPGSAVQLTNCTFHSNNVPVQIVDGAQFHADNCDMTDSIKVPFSHLGKVTANQYEPLTCLDKYVHANFTSIYD